MEMKVYENDKNDFFIIKLYVKSCDYGVIMVNFDIIRHQTHSWERRFCLVIFRVTKTTLKICYKMLP
jgi:hypothetical protein